MVDTGGGRKPSPINEQSSMVVETVEKKAGAGGKIRKFRGDASKVLVKGQGLKKAFTNRLMNFQIETKDAGKNWMDYQIENSYLLVSKISLSRAFQVLQNTVV